MGRVRKREALIGEMREKFEQIFNAVAGFMGKTGQGLESASIPRMWTSGILEKSSALVDAYLKVWRSGRRSRV